MRSHTEAEGGPQLPAECIQITGFLFYQERTRDPLEVPVGCCGGGAPRGSSDERKTHLTISPAPKGLLEWAVMTFI